MHPTRKHHVMTQSYLTCHTVCRKQLHSEEHLVVCRGGDGDPDQVDGGGCSFSAPWIPDNATHCGGWL